MDLTNYTESNVTVVNVTGSIDGFTSDDLLHHLESQIQAGAKQIVVNLCEVDFISSAGLRAILQAQKLLRQQDGALGGDVETRSAIR